jgi:hypothetical protein
MFDLGKSTADWLGDLKQSGAFEDADLEELESHLKDGLEQLMDHGLSPKEAFWVATNRLGNREELPDEYAKTNSRTVWKRRFLWMVVGILAYVVLNSVVFLFSYGATLAAVSSGMGYNSAATISFSVQVLLTCGALVSSYFVLSSGRFEVSGRSRKARQSRSRAVLLLAVSAALLAVVTWLWLFAAWHLLQNHVDMGTLSQTSWAISSATPFFSVIFALSLACLAFVLSRPRKSKVDLGLER